MKATITQYLQHLCGKEQVHMDEPLSRWTTFRVGGPADWLVTVPTKTALVRMLSALTYLEQPYFILGRGANVLASDTGYRGVVLHPTFHEIYHNDQFVYADAGATLGAVVNYAAEHGLAGLAWATGIPGSIGGAVYMNAGAFGGCVADVVVLVDVWDGTKVRTLTAAELQFGYRTSVLQHQAWVVLGAYFKLEPGDPTAIRAEMQQIAVKRARHPQQPSAGSTFRRPHDGFYVGREIEQAGLAGYQIGGAQVSPEHCGFIVNTGSATAADIRQLIDHIRAVIKERTGVELTLEIVFLE